MVGHVQAHVNSVREDQDLKVAEDLKVVAVGVEEEEKVVDVVVEDVNENQEYQNHIGMLTYQMM